MSYFIRSFSSPDEALSSQPLPPNIHKLFNESVHADVVSTLPPGTFSGDGTPSVPCTPGGLEVLSPFIHVHSLVPISYLHKSFRKLPPQSHKFPVVSTHVGIPETLFPGEFVIEGTPCVP